MTRILLLAWMVGLVLLRADSLQAQDRVYPIFELTDADLARIDLHDGSVGEWEEILGDATVTALEFIGEYDPANLDFRIWVAWHDATNRFYVAAEYADDVYVNTFDRADFSSMNFHMGGHDGSVTFIIDADYSGGGQWTGKRIDTPEDYLLFEQHTQWYMALGEVFDNGPNIETMKKPMAFQYYTGPNWYEQPPYAEGGGGHFGENPTITATEFYVTPFDRLIWNVEEESVVSTLEAGRVIGFALRISDRDNPGSDFGDTQGNTSFYLGEAAQCTICSANLLTGLLVPHEEDLVEVVEDENQGGFADKTWGRIKATFDMEIP